MGPDFSSGALWKTRGPGSSEPGALPLTPAGPSEFAKEPTIEPGALTPIKVVLF